MESIRFGINDIEIEGKPDGSPKLPFNHGERSSIGRAVDL
jgi:hypothetical protein